MKKLFLANYLFFITFQAQGFDFGKVATSFEVKEEGFTVMMMRKLKTVDLEAENKKMAQIARQRIEEPTPVESIKPATKGREFWYDPTFVLKNDVVLPCGKVLYKAGTSVNPLDHMDLERRLFFVDGRDQKQIEWLKEHLGKNRENKIEDKVILVAGSVFKLQEELGTKVYFDQAGDLTGKMGITASPAVAEQDGKMVKVVEVYLE